MDIVCELGSGEITDFANKNAEIPAGLVGDYYQLLFDAETKRYFIKHVLCMGMAGNSEQCWLIDEATGKVPSSILIKAKSFKDDHQNSNQE